MIYNLRERAAFAVSCPVCSAPAGEPCRSTDMRRPGEAVHAHRGRIDRAEAPPAYAGAYDAVRNARP